MKYKYYLSLCVLFFVSRFLYGQDIKLKHIDSIRVYAINPKMIESFASISYRSIVNDKDHFTTLIKKNHKIEMITTAIMDLHVCDSLEISKFSSRVVFKMFFADNSTKLLIFDNFYSQMINFDGLLCKPNKHMYKLMLKTLPIKWRLGIHPKNGNDCSPIKLWGSG